MEKKKQRFFIELAYKGTRYHGWQIQKNALSIQELLDKALSLVFQQRIETVGCGRTDTGVHARQFFAHFDLELSKQTLESDRILHSINSILPPDIGIRGFQVVESDAHARFDATSRSYEYHIHFEKDPFLTDFSWQIRKKPDLDLMNVGANIIKSYSDFSCFSKSHTQVYTNNCDIHQAYWVYPDMKTLVFYITANRFLRNMVRAIVGTLLDVGHGVYPADVLHDILKSKDRSQAGTSVPAQGLYLTQITYPYINTGGAHG